MSDKRRPDKTFTPKLTANVAEFETYEPQWSKMSDIEAKQQTWFWPVMIPSGTLTLFGGIGGIGKSLLLLYIAAKTTTGEAFHAGGIEHQLPKGGVILLSAEDDIEQQIKPKLIAMNADHEKIHHLIAKKGTKSGKQKFISLITDLEFIEQKIAQEGDIKLIIIDPITYFTGELRDHVNPEVANFLQSLVMLAKKYNIAVLLNKHLRKQASGTRGANLASDEVGGAGAWTNTPRRCWLITNHPENPEIKLIAKMKDNLGARSKDCLAYKIMPIAVSQDNAFIETTTIVWLNEMQNISAEEAINPEKHQKSKQQEVVEFIFNYLRENGVSQYKNIYEAGCTAGYSHRQLSAAKKIIKDEHKDEIKISKAKFHNGDELTLIEI